MAAPVSNPSSLI